MFTLGLNAAKNTHSIEKKLQIKVVWNRISNRNVRKHICLSPICVELGVCKDQYVWNLIMYRNGKLNLHWGLNAAKNTRSIEKASNKSCSESNFVQKSQWAHMSISPTSGAERLQRSVWLKSYNVQKWEIRFTLGFDTHFREKTTNKSFSESNFVRICLTPSRVSLCFG